MDWELFTDQIQQVPANATDPAGPLPTFLTPDDNRHTWTNFLKTYQLPTVNQVAVADTLGAMHLPLVSLLCMGVLLPVGWQIRSRRRQGGSVRGLVLVALLLASGTVVGYPFFQIDVARPQLAAGELSDEQAELLLATLLKNVYRAFDFREESDVYDKLAVSVSGDLLEEIYLQNRKSFAVKKAGGAQAKIKEVDIVKASARRVEDDSLAYAIQGNWTAMGTVGHWGHVHMRANQYDAIVTVRSVEGNWKITGLELLEEKRVEPNAGGTTNRGHGAAPTSVGVTP